MKLMTKSLIGAKRGLVIWGAHDIPHDMISLLYGSIESELRLKKVYKIKKNTWDSIQIFLYCFINNTCLTLCWVQMMKMINKFLS